jgi:ubiquinone/menaquinone biosynthesis C-methylase UbiE
VSALTRAPGIIDRVVIDSRERFSLAASDYEAHRPSYPDALVDWLLAVSRLAPAGRIADVGCGTGISTRLLAARGRPVVGIDPNPQMLARAQAKGGEYLRGEATATGLAAASVDLVTVAQAFHWFDVEPTLRELQRILKPGGWCAAFWNRRATSPFLDAYESLLREHSSEYGKAPKPDAVIAAIRADRRVGSLQEASFENHQWLGRDGLRGRTHSSSYVVHGVADPEALDRGLGALFDAFATEGCVDMAYRTTAYAFQLS